MRINPANNALGGRSIQLYADDGDRFYYAHLETWEPGGVATYVADERRVVAGEVIGTVGTSGNAPANLPHLHFEFHPARANGAAVNPYPELRRLVASSPTVASIVVAGDVLLPTYSAVLADNLIGRDLGTLAWDNIAAPGLHAWASSLLSLPLGTRVRGVVNGIPVVADVERHDRYGNNPSAPVNAHKGVTVRRAATIDLGTGARVPLAVPPIGWPRAS